MKKLSLLTIAALIGLTACIKEEDTGAERESRATTQLLNQASTIVGIPAIQNFTEKRLLKMLYELRDNASLVTYSYYVDLNGNRHSICPTTSVGFGIPFSAQFTAPTRDERTGQSGVKTIHQPEPNGLYMPDSTSATWVMCLDPKSKEPVPVYVEPLVIVSTVPLS